MHAMHSALDTDIKIKELGLAVADAKRKQIKK